MLFAPQAIEWLAIYLPLTIALSIAIVIELRTRKIPNYLVVAVFAYSVAARMWLGPEERWQYLASAGFATGISIGLGYGLGLIPAGTVKLTVAVAAALVPWMAVVISGSPLLAMVALWIGVKLAPRSFENIKHGFLPGSLAVASLTTLVVAASAMFGQRT